LKEDRIKSSQCDLYILGYTCATVINYKKLQKNKIFIKLISKNYQSSNYKLQFAYMKMESQVIVNQNVTVN